MEYHGKNGSNLLYVDDELGVVVNGDSNLVTSIDQKEALIASAQWDATADEPEGSAHELAKAAVTELDIKVLSSNDRMYTIPKGVVAEAKRGLKWRKEEDRGGTRVGMNTARTLAKGGQIGIRKVRHIAKYFPRHEVDKKAKGYRPGEDNYPSNGRIAWALWGGDAAQRWASAIVEREDKKEKNASVIASLYEEFYGDERIDYNSFGHSGEQGSFYIRLNLRNGKIDRLYMVKPSGECKVWDDGYWDDMGDVDHGFASYDAELDSPEDKDEKAYVLVDRETAIVVSAFLDENPMGATDLKSIQPEETELFESAMPEMDWEDLDQFNDESVDFLDELSEEEDLMDDEDALTAAGTEFVEDDGYTSEERSEAASEQPRDKLGRFVEVGSRVVIGGDYNYQGNVTSVNAETSEANVELDNGETVSVPTNTIQQADTFEPIDPQKNFPVNELDFSGILGEPRVPIDQPTAQLPGRLPPLTATDVNTLVEDWGAWVADQRLAPEYDGDPIPPRTYKEVPDINTALGKYYKGAFNPDGSAKKGWNPATAENVYNEPLLRDWLDEKYGNKSGVGKGQTYAGGWYRGKSYSGVDIEDKKSRDEVMSRENRKQYDEKYDPMNFSITAGADKVKERKLTPENSDVAPMYMAIVAEDDPQAVMNLVALVPASTKTVKPSAFIRKPGEWVRDDSIIADLNSPTPPPVVVLDNENLADVTMQIDGDEAQVASAYTFANVAVRLHFAHTNNQTISALIAAGGADRNRGNAENLRRYWTIGKGGLKIRWNTPGDWTRCNRYLRKYMGPRAKGYCALRHKEMTGVWPGDKRNVGKKNTAIMASGVDNTLRSEEEIIEMSTLRARAMAARAKVTGRHSAKPHQHGAKFVIPLVIPEETETGDGRIFEKNSITMRDLPLPLLWQIKTGNGHDGSVVVGQITHMERIDKGIGNAVGVFDTGEYGQEAERLVRHGFIRGVSADMDKFEADDEMPEPEAGEDSDEKGSGRINITSARVMAVTVVPKPAFQECYIQIVEDSDSKEETMQPDGVYVDNVNPLDASALVACGMVADAIPMHPPAEWFGDPKLKKATPLTILDDGRVFGHIAAWHVDHIGMAFGTKPPRSRSKYAYFHTGVVKTNEGEDVKVGQLTLAGGHAGLEDDAVAAAKHYDDTASAFADVHAGEDAYGIWVAGSLRPGTTPDMIRAARASAPSGDWRPIKGSLELVAVCQVNVPGFPITRARVASGQVMALVAAGANVLAQMKHDPMQELSDKVAALEAAQLSPQREEAKAKFAALQEELKSEYRAKMDALAAKVKDPLKKDREDEEDESWEYMIQMMDGPTETAIIPRRVRRRLAREGKALPDGSFPIRNISDLRNAIRAYGRATAGKRGQVKKHIMRRARALDRPDLIPPKWSTRYKGEAAVAIDQFRDYSEETREQYAKEGKALPDGSFPIANVEDLKRAIKAHGRAKDIAKAKAHIKKRARALDASDLIPEEWKNASLMERADEVRAKAELAVEYENLEALFSEGSLTAAAVDDEDLKDLEPEEIEVIKQEAKKDDEDRVPKFTPGDQPRDEQGRFRKVLARIKSDLGQSGLDDVIKKVEEAEGLAFGGDYDRASESADDLIGIIDRLDAKALNPEALENVRSSARELGEVIANLPFAFGEASEKIRYSDVPPALQKLIEDMIDRVETKIGPEDADVATADLKNFMAGGDYYNQSEISSQMAKLLRLLT